MKRRLHALLTLCAGLIALLLLRLPSNTSSPSSSVSFDQVPVSSTAPTSPVDPSAASSTDLTNAAIVKVVDGDTLEVLIDGETASRKIRLLGVNTPESVDPRRPVECFGKEASRFLSGLVGESRVRLQEDFEADDRDKYGRLLRNVFLKDGTDVNALLVREGYAHAYLSFPLNKQRKNELRRLEAEAKEAQRGLWNVETCDGMK